MYLFCIIRYIRWVRDIWLVIGSESNHPGLESKLKLRIQGAFDFSIYFIILNLELAFHPLQKWSFNYYHNHLVAHSTFSSND